MTAYKISPKSAKVLINITNMIEYSIMMDKSTLNYNMCFEKEWKN